MLKIYSINTFDERAKGSYDGNIYGASQEMSDGLQAACPVIALLLLGSCSCSRIRRNKEG